METNTSPNIRDEILGRYSILYEGSTRKPSKEIVQIMEQVAQLIKSGKLSKYPIHNSSFLQRDRFSREVSKVFGEVRNGKWEIYKSYFTPEEWDSFWKWIRLNQ